MDSDDPAPGTGGRPDNHAVWAILALFACWNAIAGPVALYFAWQVDRRWRRGDRDGATRASRHAATWSAVGIGSTALLIAVAAIVSVVAPRSP